MAKASSIPGVITSVGTFVSPLSQFEKNETPDACVAYGIKDIQYCGPPDGKPTGTAEQIDAEADEWYGKIEGSYSANNTNGMSLGAEYEMLQGLGLKYEILSPDTASIQNAINTKKCPVLLTGAERSFFDVQLGKIPYAWDYGLYNHCIVVCGLTPGGNILVRDYANLMAEPGSVREYDSNRLIIISATSVQPPWFVPPAPPAPPLLQPSADDLHVWNLIHAEVPFDPTHAIPQTWLVARWKHGQNFGPALEEEVNMTDVYKTSYTVVEQQFTCARASWHGDTGKTTWYDSRGVALEV